MALTRRIARPLLSSSFITSGTQVLREPGAAAEELRPWLDKVGPAARARGIPVPQDPATAARALASVQVAAAGALALGKAPRTSAALLAAALLPTALATTASGNPDASRRKVTEATRNASLVGGLLLAALDTEGRPGLAWRARRASRDARRQARHLAKETALEAKLAAKSIG